MALKAILSAEEFGSLAEPVREFYKKSEGSDDAKAYVLDAEGVEDVGGLKSALQKERERAGNVETQYRETISKYKDIDPDRAREALTQLSDLKNKQLEEAGQFEEVKTNLKSTYESEMAAIRAELGARVDKTTEQLRKVTIERQLADEFAKQGGIASASGIFLDSASKSVTLAEDFSVSISDGKSKDISEYVKNLKDTESFGIFFNADVATGSGASTQTSRGTGDPKAKKASEMTDSEKAAYIGKHGSAAWIEHIKKG